MTGNLENFCELNKACMATLLSFGTELQSAGFFLGQSHTVAYFRCWTSLGSAYFRSSAPPSSPTANWRPHGIAIPRQEHATLASPRRETPPPRREVPAPLLSIPVTTFTSSPSPCSTPRLRQGALLDRRDDGTLQEEDQEQQEQQEIPGHVRAEGGARDMDATP